MLWRVSSKVATLEGHIGLITKIKFNGSGELVATVSFDKTCCATDQLVWKVECGSSITSLVWRDEENIITGCWDGKIQQWKVDKEQRIWTSWMKPGQGGVDLEGHSIEVMSLDYKPESSLLASSSADKNVIVQKLDSPSSSAQLHTLTGHK